MLFRKWLYANPGKHAIPHQYKAAFEGPCTSSAGNNTRTISADVAGVPKLYVQLDP